jgi:plasmid stabilization system protein ParE
VPQKYKVIVSDDAGQNLAEIDDFIFANSPQNAKAVSAELDAAIDGLEIFPYRFKIHETNADPAKIVRSMPVPPFVVFYRIIESVMTVEIITVRHGARDRPPKFFG